MRRCEWLIRGALAFCLVYTGVALRDRGHEYFPFFAWDLFSTVPNPQGADYTARLIAAEGFRGGLPVWFQDAHLQPADQLVTGLFALRNLGALLHDKKPEEAEVARKQFEARYLSTLRHVRYEVVQRVYDVRKRVDCYTCFIETRVLATYSTG